MKTVVDTLEKSGHKVFQWTPYKHDHARDLIGSIYAADAGKVSQHMISVFSNHTLIR